MPSELDNTRPQTDASAEYSPSLGASDPIGSHGDTDREGEMAKADLYKLASYAHKLYQQMGDQDQLESWVQAKITKAADYIASVYHYLEYEMKFTEYAHHLDNSDTLSEGQKMKIKELLSEAKSKMKDLKKTQADKVKEKKVDEGILSGGERPCSECGGSGMVYEEPTPIPDHVKSKVEKYNKQAKAFHAASKRLDKNHNGIPDDEELDELTAEYPGGSTNFSTGEVKGTYTPAPTKESFDEKSKVGDTKKTRTGELTKTSTGVKHTNTSYHDDGEAEEKSGKGVKSHAKAQSASEKKDRAPAQKMSPKKDKTWGMKDGSKFDNRDKVDEAKKKGDGNLANNAKPYDKVTRGDVIAGRLGKDEKGGKVKEAKEEKFDALKHVKNPTKGEKDAAKDVKRGSYADRAAMLKSAEADGRLKEASKPSAGLSKAKKSAVVKDAKAGKDIGKPGKSFDKVAKAAGGGEKGEKIAAAAMWKNMKETVAYMSEKKAISKKDTVAKGDKMADEGNEFSGELAKAKAQHKDSFSVDGKTYPVKESSEFTRMQEQLTRLNRAEKPMVAESREVDQIRALTKRLLG
jgi:hypothetical protein